MKLWKITIFGITFIAVMFVWIFLFGVSSNQPGSFFDKGHNAVWAGHKWVAQDMSDGDISEFVDNLANHGIDTVFVHVGPINEDGTIDPDVYQYALDFLDRARRQNSDIQYQAWLGQIRSKLDLSIVNVRHNISKQVLILSEFVGFDGVHFDVEPVWDGDGDFIKLLEESKSVMSEDKKMSVALAEFVPGVFLWFFENVVSFNNYNSEVSYENVAEYADQVVVMVYDTSLKRPWLYRWFVSEQTIRVTDLLDGKEVFVGLPAYDYYGDDFVDAEAAREWFDPETENLENGLKGVIKGLNNFRSGDENFAGVAIYPYWQIDEDEWAVYDSLWLSK